jgi:hypothetical protein
VTLNLLRDKAVQPTKEKDIMGIDLALVEVKVMKTGIQLLKAKIMAGMSFLEIKMKSSSSHPKCPLDTLRAV